MTNRRQPDSANDVLVKVDGKAEITRGIVTSMPLAGFLPNYAAAEIYASLREYGRRTRHGYAFTDNIGYLVKLPNRQSFSPDASYYAGQATGMRLIEGVPVFAVEVRSEGDYGATAERMLKEKPWPTPNRPYRAGPCRSKISFPMRLIWISTSRSGCLHLRGRGGWVPRRGRRRRSPSARPLRWLPPHP